ACSAETRSRRRLAFVALQFNYGVELDCFGPTAATTKVNTCSSVPGLILRSNISVRAKQPQDQYLDEKVSTTELIRCTMQPTPFRCRAPLRPDAAHSDNARRMRAAWDGS